MHRHKAADKNVSHLRLTQEHVDVRGKRRIELRIILFILNSTNMVYFHWIRSILLPLSFWKKRQTHLNELQLQLRIVLLSRNHNKDFSKENKPLPSLSFKIHKCKFSRPSNELSIEEFPLLLYSKSGLFIESQVDIAPSVETESSKCGGGTMLLQSAVAGTTFST